MQVSQKKKKIKYNVEIYTRKKREFLKTLIKIKLNYLK